ncbi:MAG TPA: nucleotidyl transferase AbiEii/AbiGii toxin family protein [Polyangiaceae bacterium]|nr:nucleotidyl transferase AbiEii/AbiGii toxin family protein [Polyangiaceae bacterium]
MLLLDGPLTFREFMTHEEIPLATVFRGVLLYLATREDAVLFGAQAVNAYCEPARMTEDIDVFSTKAAQLAEDLRAHLNARFHVAIRVREVVPGVGFRVYQARKPKHRHLVDVRQVESLPEHQLVQGVRVVTPVELVAMKAVSIIQRSRQVKAHTDRADLSRLLLAFPDLRTNEPLIAERLRGLGAPLEALEVWRQSAAERAIEPDDDSDLNY